MTGTIARAKKRAMCVCVFPKNQIIHKLGYLIDIKALLLCVIIANALFAASKSDSLLAIFDQAEKAHKAEQDSLRNDSVARASEKTSLEDQPAEQENSSTYDISKPLELSVEPSGELDSLQTMIDRKSKSLFRDPVFKKLKSYPADQHSNFMMFLIKKKVKDTNAVTGFLNAYIKILELEKQKMSLIAMSQKGNQRYVIGLHLRAKQEEIKQLSELAASLTPNPDEKIQYEKQTLSID